MKLSKLRRLTAIIVCVSMLMLSIQNVFATEINLGVAAENAMNEKTETINELQQEIINENLQDFLLKEDELAENDEIVNNAEDVEVELGEDDDSLEKDLSVLAEKYDETENEQEEEPEIDNNDETNSTINADIENAEYDNELESELENEEIEVIENNEINDEDETDLNFEIEESLDNDETVENCDEFENKSNAELDAEVVETTEKEDETNVTENSISDDNEVKEESETEIDIENDINEIEKIDNTILEETKEKENNACDDSINSENILSTEDIENTDTTIINDIEESNVECESETEISVSQIENNEVDNNVLKDEVIIDAEIVLNNEIGSNINASESILINDTQIIVNEDKYCERVTDIQNDNISTLSIVNEIENTVLDLASVSDANNSELAQGHDKEVKTLFGSGTNDVYFGFSGVVGSVDYSKMYLSNTAFDTALYSITGLYTNSTVLDAVIDPSTSLTCRNSVTEIIIKNELHPTNLSRYFQFFGQLEIIRCESEVSFGTFVKTDALTNKTLTEMFDGCENLSQVGNTANTIELDINTSQITSMESMFNGVGSSCTDDLTFDLLSFDTNKVTNMDNMFNDCQNLKTIYATDLFATSSLTTSIDMFLGCDSICGSEGTVYDSTLVDAKMAHIDMYYNENDGKGTPGYFTEKLETKTDFYTLETGWCMFEPASISYIKFAEVDTLNQVLPWNIIDSTLYGKFLVSTMSGLWCVITEETVSKKLTAWVVAPKMSPKTIIKPVCTSLFSGFAGVEWIDLSMHNPYNQDIQFIVAENTDMEDMFGGCASMSFVVFGQNFDTKNVTSMKNMFQDCASLISIDFDMDTENLVIFSEVFERCASLSEINFGPKFNASKVTSFEEAFSGCASIKNLDISMFSFAKANDCRSMFKGCSSLKTVKFPTDITAPYLRSISEMFVQCSSLSSIDLSGFDTSNVEEMDSVFKDCISLTNVKLDNKFDTSNTQSMSWMFNNCTSLVNLDLSSFNTKKVFRFSEMFVNCILLQNLDISSFTAESLQRVDGMFASCSSIVSIDLRNLDTSKLEYTENMFNACSNLTTIYVSDSFVTTAILDNGLNMFLNCNNLVGGNGTIYDANYINKEYARIDSEGTPGYFTDATNKHTVTFETNGGSIIAPVLVNDGEKVVRPANPTKDGYTFANWYEDEALTVLFDFENKIINIDTTIYAKWDFVVNQYTVTFNTNGGSAIDSVLVNENEKLIRPTNPRKSGYSFVAWYIDTKLKTKFDFDTLITSNMTLYAKWFKSGNSSSSGGSGGGGSSGRIPSIDAMISKDSNSNVKYGRANSWLYEPLINKWYRIGADGKSITGWIKDSDGSWYYLGSNHIMQEGYNFIDGKWYYFALYDNEKAGKLRGQMYANEFTPDGRFADANGEVK